MKKLLVLLPLLALAAFAEPVTLTNSEAARLLAALRSTQAGTTAINTRNGALDINTLRPVVEAYEAGQQVVAVKAAKISTTDPAREAKMAELNVEAVALAKANNTINLTLFALSDDEIRDAKVPMDAFAEFLRFLAPSAPKK